MDFAVRHPHIRLWLHLHTVGGMPIRPRGDQPDSQIDPGDRGIHAQAEA